MPAAPLYSVPSVGRPGVFGVIAGLLGVAAGALAFRRLRRRRWRPL